MYECTIFVRPDQYRLNIVRVIESILYFEMIIFNYLNKSEENLMDSSVIYKFVIK